MYNIPAKLAVFLLVELLDPPGRVDELLLARVERMTGGADVDLQFVAERRSRLERISARTGDGDLFVFRMDILFHGKPRR